MALDPSIILGGHPVQQQNPLELVSTVAQLQGIREQTEARRLAADKARQDAADQAAIRNVFAATNGDLDKALPELYKVSPRAAAVFEEQVNKARKEGFDAHKSQLDLSSKQLDLGIKLLQGATDQQSYDVVLPMIGTMAPDIAKAMGPTYDPARVQQFLQVGLTQKDIYDRRKDALQLFTDGKANEAVGTYLSTARSADEWNGFKAGAKAQGVPAGIVDAYGEYSPENVARAATLAISPSKRAELAGQAETRAQTAAQQAAQLAISRGQLGVAIARERREAATPELVQVMQDGKAVWVPKSQAIGQAAAGGAAGRPSTGAERQSLAYYNRAKEASEILTTPDASGSALEDRVPGEVTKWVGSIPVVGNYLQGAEAQAYTQAQRAFTEARLRKESGARINESEYENDRRTYFAQPGDSAALRAQKKAAREKVLNGLAFTAGRAYEEYYGEPFTRETGTTAAPPAAPAAPKVGDIVTVKGQRVRVTKLLPNGKYEGEVVR